MNEIFYLLSEVEDPRQAHKVKHSIADILLLVLFTKIANIETWEEIEDFGLHYEKDLKKYGTFENGIPSHDTIQRVMAIVSPEVTAEMQRQWVEYVHGGETDKLRKILNIDGKTIRGNKSRTQEPLHIVSALSKADGVCLGQIPVDKKSNEIIAILKLIDQLLSLKGNVVTIDAMGTQKDIVKKIVQKKADYCLAVKQNQKTLYADISEYMDDPLFRKEMKEAGNHVRTIEKARGNSEKRTYYLCSEIDWLIERHPDWVALHSIGMVETVIESEEQTTTEKRYYITNFDNGVEFFARCVRGHWAIESLHWLLDVTFREDANKTLNKTAAQNLNNLSKLALAVLKEIDFGKKMSYRRKRFNLSLNFSTYLDTLFKM